MICQCAKAHRTPVVVCTGIYKLSPMYPFDTESLVEVGDTGKVLNFEDGRLCLYLHMLCILLIIYDF